MPAASKVGGSSTGRDCEREPWGSHFERKGVRPTVRAEVVRMQSRERAAGYSAGYGRKAVVPWCHRRRTVTHRNHGSTEYPQCCGCGACASVDGRTGTLPTNGLYSSTLPSAWSQQLSPVPVAPRDSYRISTCTEGKEGSTGDCSRGIASECMRRKAEDLAAAKRNTPGVTRKISRTVGIGISIMIPQCSVLPRRDASMQSSKFDVFVDSLPSSGVVGLDDQRALVHFAADTEGSVLLTNDIGHLMLYSLEAGERRPKNGPRSPRSTQDFVHKCLYRRDTALGQSGGGAEQVGGPRGR
ncbi:hypothetical protein BV25DRAFT_1837480 [Artomyces pyxidatus]|uniref:Uncharacterized protein n=1 Tax=Artomyces pyxidatus TaxID=48021 RepID=A0ACB8T5A4_9AGAM|nr:hypothetical protein BV25DRAFT_1837480 [Artomyces pyxidatus]